jgi:hypothetical protein
MAITYPVGARHRMNFTAASPCGILAANTVTCWIKRTSDAADIQSVFTQHRDTTAGTGSEVDVFIDTAGDDLWIDSVAQSGPTNLVVGDWYFIAFVNTAGSCRIYWDVEGGASLSTGADAGLIGQGGHALNYITVGAYMDGGGDEFRGSICCLRAWASALNTTEIALERDSASAVKSGAYVDWRMDTTASSPTFSNGSYSITATGSPTTDTDEPSNIASGASVVTGRSLLLGIG